MDVIDMSGLNEADLTTLSFNRKVLMVGAGDAGTVVALARTCRILVIIPDTGSGEYEVERAHAEQLAAYLDDPSMAGNVIIHRGMFEDLAGAYMAGQFDLAVIDPGAAGLPNVEGPAYEALRIATTVAVVDDGTEQLLQGVRAPISAKSGVVVRVNGLIIARAATPLANGVY